MSRFTFSQFEPTFNKAIDHCANIIACARDNNMPIESLTLSPGYFEWFRSGVKALIETKKPDNWEELIAIIDSNDQAMQFDGVNIEKSMIQAKPVLIKYYQTAPVSVLN